jgi:eukaryotic-like serine/threonine-protein kinase
MIEPVATVEENGQKPDEPTPAEAGASSAPAGRFLHPGGSRPLEGFTIKRGIGHGGFGEVYFATSDAGKEVALKLIRRNLEIELRGIRHCLNLKHPNLLSVFDIREDARGDKWVVMEYVSGDSLEGAVAAHVDGMPINDVLNWIHGIGAGVACLHDHGIVHRDLKPGNIFCDEGVVKIGDYGLSKFISCSRRSGQTESIGTVHYMAPEVANGRYGKEIDVYALGIVLYEMLTGRVPFEGESVGEILMKHLTATPDVSMLAEPYRSVVARALEKDPAKRFGTAGAMLAALPRPEQPSPGAAQMPPGGGQPNERPAPDAPAGAAPYVAAAATNEEPIYRAVRQVLGGMSQSLGQTWNETNLNGPAKIVVLVLGGIALLVLANSLAPIAVTLFLVYGVYWVIRSVVLSIQGPPHPRSGVVPPTPPAAARAHRRQPPAGAPFKPAARCVRPREDLRPRWARHEKAADALVLKPTRERVTELIGSMLGGAVVAVTMCLVMALVGSLGSDEIYARHYSRLGWLILMSVVGTWTILVPTKAWEGSRGEPRLRRFVLMIFGLCLGLVAAGTTVALMVDLPHDSNIPSLAVGEITGLQSATMYAQHAPAQMKYYLAAFGLLLLTIRWWRQTDPLRKSRLSLWTMFGCALMAALIADACGFPQPWLVMFACAVSVSVQLSSPWIHPRQRFSRKFD